VRPRDRVLLILVAGLFLVIFSVVAWRLTSAGTSSSASSGQPASSGAGLTLPGKLLITGEATLDLVVNGHQTSVAKAPSASSYFEYPTFSPDGKRIAYVLATTPTAQGQDWGNDIYIANVDGSNGQMVLKHDKPGALIDSLSWTPDGQALIFAYSRAIYDAQNHYTGSIYQIQRLAIASGSITDLIDNAMQPSVSWDGKEIVYVDFPQNDLQAESLALANIDGSNRRKLLADQRGFQGFFAPHLSPDGSRVAFAAVGGPVTGPAGSATPASGRGAALPSLLAAGGAALARALLPGTARADGSPYQVWIASIDGSELHTVSNLREDLPFPLWFTNGQSILFLGAGGLYTASADGTNLKRLGPGVPHGEIAWYQGP
jgi:Tol biopolymer transport system component